MTCFPFAGTEVGVDEGAGAGGGVGTDAGVGTETETIAGAGETAGAGAVREASVKAGAEWLVSLVGGPASCTRSVDIVVFIAFLLVGMGPLEDAGVDSLGCEDLARDLADSMLIGESLSETVRDGFCAFALEDMSGEAGRGPIKADKAGL